MNSFMGFKIIQSSLIPDSIPCIQVRPLYLKDGTSLLSQEFLARENAWWKKEFGTKEVAFILDNNQVLALNQKMMKRLDREINRMFL